APRCSERLAPASRIPARRTAGPRREAPGDVRSRRYAASGLRSRAGDAALAVARTPADSGDAGPAWILGSHLRGGAQGAERPLPDASMAGRSVARGADRRRKAA